MAMIRSKRRLGVNEVTVRGAAHIRVHNDEGLYLWATNRGDIWNFGDGELAVAYLAAPLDYGAPLMPGVPRRHGYPSMERDRIRTGGVMLNRSFDYGQTWPDSERQWIWPNDHTMDEMLDWLRPVRAQERESIDLSDPNAIIHVCHG